MKIQCNAFLAIGAMTMATLVVGSATPVSADINGTTFSYQSMNFQGTGGSDPAVPFGVPTIVDGMTINSMATPLPPIPALGIPEGSELIQFWFNTVNDGFLANSSFGATQILIAGLNWGDDPRPAVSVGGFAFLSFDIDGVLQELDGAIPNPFDPNPADPPLNTALPIEIPVGTPADTFLLDTNDLGAPLSIALGGLGIETPLNVNSMHLEYVIAHVPEPGSLALFGCGLALVGFRRRKR